MPALPWKGWLQSVIQFLPPFAVAPALHVAAQLAEFSPRNPGLLGLNVNRGAEVKIRLRPARDDDSFYDWNHILGTMLHEVCAQRQWQWRRPRACTCHDAAAACS
jgi:hypothetical protein